MNAGLLYLNPSLSASSRLFRELNRDSTLLERFVVSSSQARHRPRRPARGRSPASSTTSPPPPARSAPSRQALRRRDRAAAALHAPREHDLREPARDARRPRPAGRRLQARRQEAAPVPRRAAPAGARRAADVPRPQPTARAARRRQRPDRARQRPGRRCATSPSAPSTRNGKERQGALPGLDQGARGGHAAARLLPALRGRPDRLVRRLQPLRHLRRARRAPRASASTPTRSRSLDGPAQPVPPELRDEVFQAVGGDRPAQPLPGRRDREPGRLATLQADAGLQLRPDPDARRAS